MPTLLTKSKYLAGIQCHKLLWYLFNKPDVFPEVSAEKQAIFDQGHLVGDYSKQLFPNGVEIKYKDTFPNKIRKTNLLIKNRKIIFEAMIVKNNLYSQPDILVPVNKDEWDIFEVKSATKVKDINLEDVAFQKYLYELYGLKIRKSYVMVINNEYVRKGKIEPEKLFKKIEVSEEIKDLISSVKQKADEMFKIINLKNPPDIKIGPWCSNPYDCDLNYMCWDFIPKHNVTNLYRISSKQFDLINNGILKIKDVPDDFKVTANQRKQIECAKTNKPYINKEKIKEFIDELEYPLYFLDFESVNPAVPLFDNTRPYQQIVFQYSLHIKKTKNSELEHFGLIATKDPRKEIIEDLKQNLGKKGSIIVYNQSFEIQRLKDMAAWFPEHSKFIENTIKRVVDLITPFRRFYYYHPEQQGSCSIKYVLPVLTDLSYENMAIPDGGEAQREYVRVTQTEVSYKEKKKVFKALEKYCELDTYAMVEILEKLKALI